MWTFVYDVSGIKSVQLYWRQDDDGVNPLHDHANELYEPEKHGYSGVGPWQTLDMTFRQFPSGNYSGVNFFVLPKYIADEYWVRIDGLKNVLIDYYVQVRD